MVALPMPWENNNDEYDDGYGHVDDESAIASDTTSASASTCKSRLTIVVARWGFTGKYGSGAKR